MDTTDWDKEEPEEEPERDNKQLDGPARINSKPPRLKPEDYKRSAIVEQMKAAKQGKLTKRDSSLPI